MFSTAKISITISIKYITLIQITLIGPLGETRTPGLVVRSHAFYPLNYEGIHYLVLVLRVGFEPTKISHL